MALAARIQGKYWEAHRAIFEIKGPIGEASALKAVEKLGLDIEKLKRTWPRPEVDAEIQDQGTRQEDGRQRYAALPRRRSRHPRGPRKPL